MKAKLILICTGLLFIVFGCEKNKIPPVSERIQKSYKAQSVTHDGIQVYTSGGSGNIISEYSSFSMSFSSTGTVTFRDITPQSFSGQYAVNGNMLTLSGLSPEPTGSNGTLTFDITNISDDGRQLTLTALKGNPKTGNTRNVYNLVAN